MTLAIGGVFSAGCGDDDDFEGAFFTGDVSSVAGGSGCEAPNGDLLFCVDEQCTRVDADDCDFAERVGVAGGGPIQVVLRFVDDADEDGDADDDEDDSIVNQDLEVCSGDQILIEDAAVDFGGVTTATVSKTVDNCTDGSPIRTNTPGGATPTRTVTPGGPTPTRTPTTGGATPTPAPTYGVTMNDEPRPTFVFFASLGLIGLLLPRRRRKRESPTRPASQTPGGRSR